MPSSVSALQKELLKFTPVLPAVLKGGPAAILPKRGKPTESVSDQAGIRGLFPRPTARRRSLSARGRTPP